MNLPEITYPQDTKERVRNLLVQEARRTPKRSRKWLALPVVIAVDLASRRWQEYRELVHIGFVGIGCGDEGVEEPWHPAGHGHGMYAVLFGARALGELVEKVPWRVQIQLSVAKLPVAECVFEQLVRVHAVAARRPPQPGGQ